MQRSKRSKRLIRRSPSLEPEEVHDDSEPDEEYAPLLPGHVAAVPMTMDDGIRMCLALVVREPAGSEPGLGWLLETNHDIRVEGGAGVEHDPLLDGEGRLFLSNTAVSLGSAYLMQTGFEEISGLFWETELGSRELLRMTPQYRQYLAEVRTHGIRNAVPEACSAVIRAALQRGAPKSDAHVRRLCSLLGDGEPQRMSYAVTTHCIACGAQKNCAYSLGGSPLGSDCAGVLAAARPACIAVRRLQARKRIAYPHEFQTMLEDAGVLGA